MASSGYSVGGPRLPGHSRKAVRSVFVNTVASPPMDLDSGRLKPTTGYGCSSSASVPAPMSVTCVEPYASEGGPAGRLGSCRSGYGASESVSCAGNSGIDSGGKVEYEVSSKIERCLGFDSGTDGVVVGVSGFGLEDGIAGSLCSCKSGLGSHSVCSACASEHGVEGNSVGSVVAGDVGLVDEVCLVSGIGVDRGLVDSGPGLVGSLSVCGAAVGGQAPAPSGSSGDDGSVGGRRWQLQRRRQRKKRRNRRDFGFVDPGSSGRFTSRATRQIEALGEYYECTETDLPDIGRLHVK